MIISASGETRTVTAASSLGLSLSAESNSNWISVSPNTVSSGGAFYITIDANPSESSRSGSLTVTSGTTYTTITVTQAAYSVALSETSRFVGPTSGFFTITVTTNGGRPSVSADADWLSGNYSGTPRSIRAASPENENAFTAYILYDANMTEAQRTGHVYFSLGGVTKTLTLVQGAGTNTLTVNPTSLNYTIGGEAKTVTMTSSLAMDCTVSSKPDWITASATTVASGGSIVFTASENTSNASRSGTITIQSGSASQTVNVAQSAHNLTISETLRSVSAKSGSFDITVTTNGGRPSVSSDADWLSGTCGLLPENGGSEPKAANTFAAYITYDANSETDRRVGHLTFTLGSVTETLTVSQSENTVTLSPSTLSFSTFGGSQSVNVIVGSGQPWTASTEQTWITVSNSGGDLEVRVGENTTGQARTGFVTVRSGKAVDTVEVTQDGNLTLYISEGTRHVGAAEGSFTIQVTANGRPHITSDANWLLCTFAGLQESVGGEEQSGAEENPAEHPEAGLIRFPAYISFDKKSGNGKTYRNDQLYPRQSNGNADCHTGCARCSEADSGQKICRDQLK